MMTKEQAFEICETAENYYNFKLTQAQIKLWIDFLSEHGDYERSLKKLNDRILSGNQYQPVLAEIVTQEIKATEVKPLNIKERKEPTQSEIEEHKRMQAKIEKEIEEKGIGLNDL